MIKKVLVITAILTAAALTACSVPKETPAAEEPAAAVTEAAAVAETSASVRDRDAVYEYETREIWCDNNGSRIYGKAYIPVSDTETRFPLVIHAHGMGSNYEVGETYCERYAQKGFAGYSFDFSGGSRPTTENKSDGDPMRMSALTEAADLQAVLDTAVTWDFVDTGNVFLEGGSMGGLIATMVGLDNTDKVKGLMLHYPALYMPQVVTARFNSPQDVPDTLSFGDDYEVGGVFVRDLWSVDVVSRLNEFEGNVIIIQGSEDSLVTASSSEEASRLFPNAQYYLIEGSGHGFSGDDFETSVQYGLDYLFANT